MPLTVNWLDESQSVIEVKFTDPWTFAEIVQSLATTQSLVGSGSSRFCILYDMAASGSAPPMDIAALRQSTQHPLIRGGRLEHIFVGGVKTSTKTMVQMGSTFFPRFFKIVKLYTSREAALRALRQHQQTDRLPIIP